jgi:hypothetical protein
VNTVMNSLMLCALITCTEFLREPTNALEFMNVILLHTLQTCFGKSCGRLQVHEDKYTVSVFLFSSP